MGYVLGTRAGRERYEQLRKSARRVAQNPAVRNTVESAGQQSRAFAGKAADLVLNPVFASADIERERGVILEEIKIDEDNPDVLVHELFTQNFWKDHPLGKPILGTSTTVARAGLPSTVSAMSRSETTFRFTSPASPWPCARPTRAPAASTSRVRTIASPPARLGRAARSRAGPPDVVGARTGEGIPGPPDGEPRTRAAGRVRMGAGRAARSGSFRRFFSTKQSYG